MAYKPYSNVILILKPKWFVTERNMCVRDSSVESLVFLKSEQEFDRQYQYGIVVTTIVSRDGIIRAVESQYQNHRENVIRITNRGVRDLIVIHPIDSPD